MATDREDRATGSEPNVEDILANYVGRLNAGEQIQPEEILVDHPTHGPEILEQLEAFIGPAQDGAGKPLGTLGDYTLRRQIGRGGMGVVYEAWQGSMDRRVALKVLPAGIAADDRAFNRFMREARAAGKLNHPNVVAVHAMGQHEHTPYFAMEFVEGETLAQVLTNLKDAEPEVDTPFGKKDCASYFENLARAFADVADGLQHAHSKGIIHRDIKPSNLILDGQGRLRILDFGLARLEGQEPLTISGDVVGTPQYMSPEQARRKKIPVDHRTDVYSLGATLYEMLTLQPPFRGKDHEDTLSQIIERDPVELRKVNARVPKDLETICLKCLLKDAGDRYGTAEALGQDLRRFVRGDEIEAKAPTPWGRVGRGLWRHRRRLGVTLLLLFALLTSGVVVHEQRLQLQKRNEAKVRREVMRLQVGLFAFGRGEVNAANMPQFQLSTVEDAVAELEKAATALPHVAAARYHLARGLVKLLRDEEALGELALALESEPGFLPAAELRASIRKRFGAEGEASANTSQRVCRPTGSWEAAWLRAQSAEGERRWEDAADAYGDLVDMQASGSELYLGSSIEALLGRGLTRLEAGKHLLALEDFSKAEALWPESLEPSILKVKVYYLIDEKSLADVELGKLFSQTARRDELAFLASVFFSYLGEHRKALEWAELMASSPGSDRELLRAQCLNNLGRSDEAERVAETAIEIQPSAPRPYIELGWLMIEHERFGKAEGLFRKAIGLDPRSIPAHVGLGRALDDLTKVGEAIEVYRHALEFSPRSSDLCTALARALCDQRGTLEEAIAMFQRAVHLDPKNPRAYAHWGENLVFRGRFADSIPLLRKALELGNMDPYTHRDLGYALDRVGKLDDAIEAYSKGVEAFPRFADNHERLTAALRRPGITDLIPALDRVVTVLERELNGDEVESLFLQTLALALVHAPSRKDGDRALDFALRALEAPDGIRKGGVATLVAVVSLVQVERLPAVGILQVLPRLPPYAAIDAVVEKERSLAPAMAAFESLKATHHGQEAAKRTAYLQGLLLFQAGDLHEAAEVLSRLAALETAEPQPTLRLAECLRAAEDPIAAEKVLRETLERGTIESKDLWDTWVAICLVDLRQSPGEVLSAFPHALREGYAADLHWLLEQVEAGDRIRINCGGSEYRSSDGKLWGQDRFFTSGTRSTPVHPEIASTGDAALYQSYRYFRFPGEAGVAPAGYRVPLPPGEYRLTLHFAELWYQEPGLARFNVTVEGAVVRKDYEPISAGYRVADQHEVATRVDDGLLDIEFVHQIEYPKISAIEIERVK